MFFYSYFLFVCLFHSLSLSLYLSIYLSIYLSTYRSIYLIMYIFLCLSSTHSFSLYAIAITTWRGALHKPEYKSSEIPVHLWYALARIARDSQKMSNGLLIILMLLNTHLFIAFTNLIKKSFLKYRMRQGNKWFLYIFTIEIADVIPGCLYYHPYSEIMGFILHKK